MKLFKGLLSLLTVSTLVACGKGTAERQDDSKETVTIKEAVLPNGETYEQVYERFMFKALDCEKDGNRNYENANSMVSSKILLRPAFNFNTRLYLLPDKTYKVEVEILKPKPEYDRISFQILGTLRKSGTWHVENEKLVLTDFGVGNIIFVDAKLAIHLKMTSPKGMELLNGSEINLTYSETGYVPAVLKAACK